MKSLRINREHTASITIVTLMLAIAPLWLMLAAANSSAQTSHDVSSSTTTTSTPSDTVLGIDNVGNLQLKWKNFAEEGFGTELSSPVVANGVVYVDFDTATLYALNATTGAHLWSFEDDATTLPPVVANGAVYIGSLDNDVFALNASTGAKLWNFTTGGRVFSSATVVNGVVYVGSSDDNAYALNASTGDKLWSFTTGGKFFSFVVANGVVYVGSSDGNVYALNTSTGTELWSFATGSSNPVPSPAVANGVVYVGSADGHVYALNATTGAKLWSFATGENPSPQVANGVVYVGSNDGNVYALNGSTGAKLWSFDDGVVPVGPLVVANGVIYVGCSPGLCAVNASTGGLMWGTDPAYGGFAAVADGVVYTFFGNSVFALNGSTGVNLWSYSVPSGTVFSYTNFNGVTVVDGTVYASATTNLDDQYPDSDTGGTVYAFSVGADLFLRIFPTPTTVHQGDLITYAFPVWNTGPTNAVHEVLNTQVPAGTVFDYIRISGTPGLGTCMRPPYLGTGQIVCHENGSMAPNTTWTVRLTVKVTAPAGTVITESAATMADTTDPNMANNTATITTTVQ